MAETRQTTISRLTELLNETIFESQKLKKELTPKTRLREDLQIDSLDRYQLGYEIECSFGISIPDEDMQGFRTIGDCINYIETHKGNKE